MKIIINIEMDDDTCTLESLEKIGFSKDHIANTYNEGLTLLLQKFGQVRTKENIHVETRVYGNQIFDVKNRELKKSDFNRIKAAMNIIKDMIAEPSGGAVIDGVDYVDLFFLETKTLCLDAINLLRDFVIEHGIDIDDLEGPN